jgi:long-chain acyl-CoA synthetase
MPTCAPVRSTTPPRWPSRSPCPLLYGVPLVIMEQWDPTETLRLIEAHGITHTHMVPTMFHRLLALPDDVRARYDLSSLRFVIHGAAPCPVDVKQR